MARAIRGDPQGLPRGFYFDQADPERSRGTRAQQRPAVPERHPGLLGKRADEILGSYLYDLLPLDVAQRRKKRLDEVFRTGKPAYFEDERQGIWFDTCGYPIFDATGKVTKLAIYGRDITERKRMEEELRENEKAAKRLAQENKVIAEIGRVISSTLKIENVYERFAEEVRKVIPFDRIVIDLVNADGNNATIRYIAGIETPSRRIGDTFLLDGSITGEIVHTRSPLLIQGEEIAKISKRYPDGLLSIKAGIQSFMGIPLISKDQVIGVLHFRSLKPNAYTESDLRLAESIGAQIAGAVANAQLFSERMRAEEALVTSEERYRTLFEGAAEGILVANIGDKQFKYADRNGYRLAVVFGPDEEKDGMLMLKDMKEHQQEEISITGLAARYFKILEKQ